MISTRLTTGHGDIILIGWLQHILLAQHQSDNRQAALADCLTDVNAVISTDTLQCETHNLAGG